MAAGLSGRPATFSGWPAIYFFRNGRPAISLYKKWPAGSQRWRAMLQCISLALFYPSRESFKHFHATGESKAFISLRFGCIPVPRSSEVHSVVAEFCLLSCCFDYRVVVLLIELFVERTCFVFLSHCALFKQSLFKSCLFALLTLLHFAYRVVNLLKILLYLSKLSCLVCCVGSLPDLVITQCTFPFNFIFVQNKMMRYDAKNTNIFSKAISFHHALQQTKEQVLRK